MDSARYGLRLYGFLLGITILGGAAIALGAAVAWPQVDAALDGGQASLASLAAAGVLGFLGLSVLAVGYLAAAYKLVADGVAAGGAVSSGESAPARDDATDAAPEPEPASADPNVGASGDTQRGPTTTQEPPAGTGNTTDSTTVGSMADAEDDELQPADPPEPSPEEIAFGGSGEDAPEAGPADEPAPSTGSESLAGRNAASDPLADPTEDE